MLTTVSHGETHHLSYVDGTSFVAIKSFLEVCQIILLDFKYLTNKNVETTAANGSIGESLLFSSNKAVVIMTLPVGVIFTNSHQLQYYLQNYQNNKIRQIIIQNDYICQNHPHVMECHPLHNIIVMSSTIQKQLAWKILIPQILSNDYFYEVLNLNLQLDQISISNRKMGSEDDVIVGSFLYIDFYTHFSEAVTETETNSIGEETIKNLFLRLWFDFIYRLDTFFFRHFKNEYCEILEQSVDSKLGAASLCDKQMEVLHLSRPVLHICSLIRHGLFKEEIETDLLNDSILNILDTVPWIMLQSFTSSTDIWSRICGGRVSEPH
jgi:hypothetical protein